MQNKADAEAFRSHVRDTYVLTVVRPAIAAVGFPNRNVYIDGGSNYQILSRYLYTEVT
jgi:hypothetical protein